MLDKHHSYQSLTESLDQSVYRVSCLSFNQESNSFSLVSGNVIAPHLGEHHQHYDVVAHRKYSPHNSQWSKFSHRLQWLSGCCDIHGGVASPGELEWVSVTRELTSRQLTALRPELAGDSTLTGAWPGLLLSNCCPNKSSEITFTCQPSRTGKQDNSPPLLPFLYLWEYPACYLS